MKLWVALCLPVLPWLELAFGGLNSAVLAIFEALCGFLGASLVLHSRAEKKLRDPFAVFLALALGAVGLGDLLCGVEFFQGGSGKIATRGIGELCYALFWASILVSLMSRCCWHALAGSALLRAVFGTVFAVFLCVQVQFVLPAQHPGGAVLTVTWAVHLLWIVAKAAGAAAAAVSSLVAASRFHFYLAHALGAMAVASLSTAYHAATANYREFSLAEPVWASALAAVTVSVTLTKEVDAAPLISPARSLRVGLGASVFLANCLVLVAVAGLRVMRVQTAFQATAIGFAVYASWFVANAVAFYTATELRKTSTRLPRPSRFALSASTADVSLMTVPGLPARPLMHEFDRLAEDYRQLAAQTNELVAALVNARSSESTARVAARIAHDIRSPLAALNVIVKEIDAMPEEPRSLARAAITRIQDIASGLLRESHEARAKGTPRSGPVAVRTVVEDVLAEKRLAVRHRRQLSLSCAESPASSGLLVNVAQVELARTLSNLVNNAVEALDGRGTVRVHILRRDERVHIEVVDDGVGISAERLAQLGRYGATFGKEGGSGIGLHAAQEFAREAGGELTIQSTVGEGTRVLLSLPAAKSSVSVPRKQQGSSARPSASA